MQALRFHENELSKFPISPRLTEIVSRALSRMIKKNIREQYAKHV